MPGRVGPSALKGQGLVGVAIAITGTHRLCRWVAVVTLALGLVAMHHLVATHAHPIRHQGSSVGMTMPAAPVSNHGTTAAGVTAMPVQPGTDGGLMQHLCQAVLTGLTLLVGLILTWRLAPCAALGPAGAGLGPDASRQRAPPLPLRLARLGVLRL
jgi:Family of unknown function (DUF6153)